MKKYVLLLIITLSSLFIHVSALRSEPFKFIAFGDMPYGDSQKIKSKFKSLIETINKRSPSFTIHIGDTKSGGSKCSDDSLNQQLKYMNSFDSALIYTPGDNEWTDCYRQGMTPINRLKYIRETYFKTSKSLGKSPITLERQSDLIKEASKFVENARFMKNDIMFMTAHVVGSNNNFEIRDLEAVKEFFERDKANILWLKDSLRKAIKTKAKAVVVAIHADMFEFGYIQKKEKFIRHSGFKRFAQNLIAEANKFKRPVLLVFGDSHQFRVFRPFPKSAGNIVALEVFGKKHMHAVEILVDPEDAFPFSIRPVFNPDN